MIGVAPDNVLDFPEDRNLISLAKDLRQGGSEFLAQYDDIQGNHYQTTIRDGRTKTERIDERDPDLEPTGDSEA